MEQRKIVAVIIENNSAFLLLKRTLWMKYQANRWSVCAGTIEQEETTEQAAFREAKKETRLEIEIKKFGKEFETIDGDRKLFVFPVLAESKTREVKISGEHIAFKWTKPRVHWDYKTVPTLEKDFEALGIDVGKPAQKKLF